MKTISLRRLAEINPPAPNFDLIHDTDTVLFLPLETVWSDVRADQTRRVPKNQVVSGYTRFHAGDIVSPKVTPTFQAGRSMIAQATGAGTTELHVLRALPGVDPRWVNYALRSKHFLREGVTAFEGVAGLQRVPQRFIEEFRVVDVSGEEQRRIADFLDERVARIDQIIACTRQGVNVRDAAYSQSTALVTGNTDRWMVGPLRRFIRSEDWRRVPLSTEERAQRKGTFPYYGASGVIDQIDDYIWSERRLLVSEDGANLLLRSSPIAFVAEGHYWVNNHAHIFEPHDGAHHFWAARIEAMSVAPWVSGSAQPKLTIDAALSLPVSAPQHPEDRVDLGYQVQEIQRHAKTRQEQLHRSISLINEYKQSLITAAVTGEFDVTTASTKIPGE